MRRLKKIKQIKIKGLLCHWHLFLVLIIFGIILGFLSNYTERTKQEITRLRSGEAVEIKRTGPVKAKAIYISAWTASSRDRVDEIIDYILDTELNAVIIDIKDSSGKILYDTDLTKSIEWATKEERIKNLTLLLKRFKRHGIYTIGRIVVFQDSSLPLKRPDLALRDKRNNRLWRNYGGRLWLDPSSKEVWDYNLAIASEGFNRGFDEINFDYIRFPSDGPLKYIKYPLWDEQNEKHEVLKDFFAYQHGKIKDMGASSADLFGMTFWHIENGYGMAIGQRVVDALPYFNYICPMLYPSHFPDNFEGMANPAEYPYEIIYSSLDKANPLLTDSNGKIMEWPKIRPWLQAFDMGARYTPNMINKQKQAVEDAGGFGWLLWNARNDYLNIKPALTLIYEPKNTTD